MEVNIEGVELGVEVGFGEMVLEEAQREAEGGGSSFSSSSLRPFPLLLPSQPSPTLSKGKIFLFETSATFLRVSRMIPPALLSYSLSTSARQARTISSSLRRFPSSSSPLFLRRFLATSAAAQPHITSDPKKYSNTLLLPKTTLPQRAPLAKLQELYGEKTMGGLYAWQVSRLPSWLEIAVGKLLRRLTGTFLYSSARAQQRRRFRLPRWTSVREREPPHG